MCLFCSHPGFILFASECQCAKVSRHKRLTHISPHFGSTLLFSCTHLVVKQVICSNSSVNQITTSFFSCKSSLLELKRWITAVLEQLQIPPCCVQLKLWMAYIRAVSHGGQPVDMLKAQPRCTETCKSCAWWCERRRPTAVPVATFMYSICWSGIQCIRYPKM